MRWAESLTEGLGLKEGLAEFRGQLRKDTRAVAEEKGVDLGRLDALEERAAAKREELRGAALAALTGDETLAKLLDLRPEPEPAPGAAAEAPRPPAGGPGGPAASAEAAAAAQRAPAARAAGEPGEPREPTAGDGAAARGAPGGARPQAAGLPAAVPGPPARWGTGAAAPPEEEPRRRGTAEALEAELREAKVQLELLESRCSELSGISDEALSRTQALQRESSFWRLQAEQQEQELKAAKAEAEASMKALREAQQRLEEPQEAPPSCAPADSRLEELVDEVAYLRKSLEAKEQKLQEVTEDRRRLEQRSSAAQVAARDPEHGLMLDAHTAIAAAFGETLSGPPLLRCVDEPLLRFTALMLRQPFFRRAFYASSALIWVFALHHIVVARHD